MPYNSHLDKFYPIETSPEKEKEIMNAASSLLAAQRRINHWFDRPTIKNDTIYDIVNDCLELSETYWQTNNAIETRIRKDSIKKHISLRLKMWIDGKEF